MARTSAAAAVANASAAANTESIFNARQQQQTAENLKQQFRQRMRAEELVPVSLAPAYRHPFGKVMIVRLHGHAIYVPCDGKTYKVPAPYAAIIAARVRAFNDQELRQERMAAVTQNAEQFAGQLQFG